MLIVMSASCSDWGKLVSAMVSGIRSSSGLGGLRGLLGRRCVLHLRVQAVSREQTTATCHTDILVA